MIAHGSGNAPRRPGELDPSFGVDGMIIPNAFTGSARAVAWDEGTRRLVYATWQQEQFRVFRTLMNGAVDTTFGANGEGFIVDSFGGESNSRPSRLLLQGDGKTVLIGDRLTDRVLGLPALARFEKGGDRDRGFGIDGNVIPEVIPGDAIELRVSNGALQQDGKILVVATYGLLRDDGSGIADYTGLVIRLEQDGGMDGNFGDNGVVEVYPKENTPISDIVVQRDGGIVVGGEVKHNDAGMEFTQLLLARFTASGVLDKTFGDAGYVAFGPPDGSCWLRRIVLDSEDRIVCAGALSQGCFVMRFDRNGAPDPGFHSGQPVVVIPPPTGGYWTTAGLQPDGKIVAAGGLYLVPPQPVFGRFHSNGNPDADVGDTGFVVGAPGDYWDLIVQDAARRIVLAGDGPGGAVIYGLLA
jgi:uncharacterized delta-60 repeat protein